MTIDIQLIDEIADADSRLAKSAKRLGPHKLRRTARQKTKLGQKSKRRRPLVKHEYRLW